MKAVVIVKMPSGGDYIAFPMWVDASIPFTRVMAGAKIIPSADVSWRFDEIFKMDLPLPPEPDPWPNGGKTDDKTS